MKRYKIKLAVSADTATLLRQFVSSLTEQNTKPLHATEVALFLLEIARTTDLAIENDTREPIVPQPDLIAQRAAIRALSEQVRQ